MSEDSRIGGLKGLDPSLRNDPRDKEAAQRTTEIGQDEFLKLLVAQLKHQDPLDPVKNEDFAVNLAQFSQLEQLVGINDKLGAEQADINSYSSYLGREVLMDTDEVSISSSGADKISFALGEDALQVGLKLLDGQGRVRDVVNLGALGTGTHTIDLSKLDAPLGRFRFEIAAEGAQGAIETKGRVSGVVSGFVPGPEPTLIVAGREINPSEIVQVRVAEEA